MQDRDFSYFFNPKRPLGVRQQETAKRSKYEPLALKPVSQVVISSGRFNTPTQFVPNPSPSVRVEETKSAGTSGERAVKLFGASNDEKQYFFTGNVERVIQWHRIFKNRTCYFEVIGTLSAIQDGDISGQKIVLLRDKIGPVLQVCYYKSYNIDDFIPGQIIRCVGYMKEPTVMSAVNIRGATSEEFATLKRYCYIGDFAISKLLQDKI